MASARGSYDDTRVAALLAEYRRTGDPRLREQVVEEMRPLVRAVARKFACREPLEDLESEGFVGLIRAVDRYSPERGTRFSTFATHMVAGQIRHYLRDRGHLIRQPAWLQELNSRVQRATEELEQRLHRTPTVAEIAEATNITEEGIEELLAARQAANVLRLETAAHDDDTDFMEVDPEKIRSRQYVTLELPMEDRIVLENALEKLKELERKVLYYFFYQEFNQSEIARKLGISCNYAGYVLRNGLKHMREGLTQERASGRSRSLQPAEETVLDPVSGAYSREPFLARLHEEIHRAQRYGHSVAVCCFQLPTTCDEPALRRAAEVLRGRTRKADVVGRIGAREFAVILPATGSVATQVAQRLAGELEGAIEGPIQASAAVYPDSGRTPQQLLDAARELGRGPLPALAPA